mmetsp:Transcript_14505/g.40063  ORF Transcript_14505/g.40063 Transcript_14505/m.40063 type:complete len:218 (-) Transcript_14505:368-1021(-)
MRSVSSSSGSRTAAGTGCWWTPGPQSCGRPTTCAPSLTVGARPSSRTSRRCALPAMQRSPGARPGSGPRRAAPHACFPSTLRAVGPAAAAARRACAGKRAASVQRTMPGRRRWCSAASRNAPGTRTAVARATRRARAIPASSLQRPRSTSSQTPSAVPAESPAVAVAATKRSRVRPAVIPMCARRTRPGSGALRTVASCHSPGAGIAGSLATAWAAM